MALVTESQLRALDCARVYDVRVDDPEIDVWMLRAARKFASCTHIAKSERGDFWLDFWCLRVVPADTRPFLEQVRVPQCERFVYREIGLSFVLEHRFGLLTYVCDENDRFPMEYEGARVALTDDQVLRLKELRTETMEIDAQIAELELRRRQLTEKL